MANECLVTKLKGVVNNPNVVPFKVYRAIFKNPTTTGNVVAFTGSFDKSTILRIVGNATWVTSQSHVTYIDTKTIRLDGNREYSSVSVSATAGEDFFIEVEDKYALTYLYIIGGANSTFTRQVHRMEELEYLPALIKVTGLPTYNIAGDIRFLATSPSLQTVAFANNDPSDNVYGDISVFADMTDLQTISFLRCTKISGDISVFGNKVSATNITLRLTGVSGNVNTMLDAMFAAGRTSGTLLVDFRGTADVTYAGTKDVSTQTITFTFSESGWVENP